MRSANYGAIVERDPSTLANQLLSHADQNGPPVDLNSILESENITTVYAPLEETGYLLDQKGKFASILVNEKTVASQRSRFTLAHELGHWILHRFAEKALEMGPPVREATHDEVEHWCDRFAAELLLPSGWLKRFAGQFEQIGRSDIILGGPEVFGVSREAFYLRLEEIYRILVAEITVSGKLTYWSREPPTDPNAWNQLSGRISETEYGLLESGPICKGPMKVLLSGRPRWTVVIVRSK